jgi:hypothetical protein
MYGPGFVPEHLNFGHDAKAALLALASARVHERRLVAKNVTHDVAWDRALMCCLRVTARSTR